MSDNEKGSEKKWEPWKSKMFPDVSGDYEGRPLVTSITDKMYAAVAYPAQWIRETLVEPNRKDYPWYHRRYQRVPTIDECYIDDKVCREEANIQYLRDKMVEQRMLNILRKRAEDCIVYEVPNQFDEGQSMCKAILEKQKLAWKNYYIKYGDLGYKHRVEDAFMKQKHRMIWERRFGPVGSGMGEPTE